ncbi:MAG TPA: hypothetical protein VNO50_10395 [Pyrinomonadaceae bacterium]|nr:hypothetical protein [Pyrinomonadaceae bacterium]
MDSISRTWGTNAEERELGFPCDHVIAGADETLFRGITINASAEVVFRWLCQMRVAPYSYDWLDNGGRRSPRELTSGLEDLERGQTVMRIFDLIDFAPNQHLTIRLKPRAPSIKLFGDIVVSYLLVPRSSQSCRLLVKLVVKHPSGLMGQIGRFFLPWGDLIMMRRQLLNFKTLAESAATPLGKRVARG